MQPAAPRRQPDRRRYRHLLPMPRLVLRLRRVARQFVPYRRQVTIVSLLILVTAGLGVANPLLVKVVFDRALFVPGGPRPGALGVDGRTWGALRVQGHLHLSSTSGESLASVP